jgi:hypothetical protein
VLCEHPYTRQYRLCTVFFHIPLVSFFDEVLECCVSVRPIQGVLRDMPRSCARVRSCASVIWPGNGTPGQAGCCSVWWGIVTPDTNDAVGDMESASKTSTWLNNKIYSFVAFNESCSIWSVYLFMVYSMMLTIAQTIQHPITGQIDYRLINR